MEDSDFCHSYLLGISVHSLSNINSLVILALELGLLSSNPKLINLKNYLGYLFLFSYLLDQR